MSAAGVPSKKLSPPSYATLLSGGLSGLTSCVLLQPLDLLKTRLQQAHSNHAELGGKTRRLVRTFQDVIKDSGPKGLWRGTWPTILRNVPGVALYFYSVTELRGLLALQPVPWLSLPSRVGADTVAQPTAAGNLLVGATARVAVGFALCPITVVKARFESSNFPPAQNATLLLSLRSIYSSGGIPGLFRGFSATALRDAPYAGLYLMFYERGKDLLSHVGFGGSDPTNARLVSGFVAGSLATILTHPFDIIKTRLQTAVTPMQASTGLVAMTTAMIRTEGLSPFLDGLGLRCARKALSSAIGWGIFEGGRDLWVRRETLKQQREGPSDVSIDK
ncbi:unnamed protein product [Parajaminaea phylloscopi]